MTLTCRFKVEYELNIFKLPNFQIISLHNYSYATFQNYKVNRIIQKNFFLVVLSRLKEKVYF